MMKLAASRPAPVTFASPGSQPPSARHCSSNSAPAARWIAPSTPPPPSSVGFAALTIASASSSRVMSPRCSVSVAGAVRSSIARRLAPGLLLDRALRPRHDLQAALGDRLAALDRQAVGAFPHARLRALDRLELLAQALGEPLVDLRLEQAGRRVGGVEDLHVFVHRVGQLR